MSDNNSNKHNIDVKTLENLRNKIGSYISILERNTEAVNSWVIEHKKDIILSHQKLTRAVSKKDAQQALNLIEEMGDIAGFVLNIGDLKPNAEKAFSGKSDVLDKISQFSLQFPDYLQEEIEEFSAEDEQKMQKIVIDALPPVEEELPSGWSVSSWFKGKEIKEKRSRMERMKEIYQIKSEIMGLQSDRHYYLESILDWVVDSLAPEAINEQGVPVDTSEKMLQYQSPSYIVDLARKDYKEATETRTRAVIADALEYAHIADSIDKQDFAGIKKSFDNLFCERDGFDKGVVYESLLEDYGVKSLFHLVFEHINSNDLQEKLFMLEVMKNEKLKFNSDLTPKEIFDKFTAKVLDNSNPISAKIIVSIVPMLQKQYGHNHNTKPSAFILPKNGNIGLLEAIAKRFSTEPEKELAAYNAAMQLVSGNEDCPAAKMFIELNNSNTAEEYLAAIKTLTDNKTVSEVMAFWKLVNTSERIERRIIKAVEKTEDTATKVELLEKSLSCGLLDKMRQDHGYIFAADFINGEILSNLEEFPIDTARAFINHIYSGEAGHKDYKNNLASSWLLKIADSKISSNKKVEWLAAFLEPVKSNIIKANLLYKATEGAGEQNKNFLSGLEHSLIGDNIDLDGKALICNTQDIANIWYNEHKQSLHYTVSGQTLDIAANITPAMAREIFELIQRRAEFKEEYGGLFKPENISVIKHGHNDDQISWYHATGALNASSDTIKELAHRDDFIHVETTDGQSYHYNIKDICLLEKKASDHYVLIDKYGVQSDLHGVVTVNESADLPEIDKGIKFNPDNASIIRLSSNNDILEFRTESTEFDKILESEFNNEALYSIPIKDPAKLAKLRTRLEGSPHILSANPADKTSLWFNIKTLDFIHLSEEPAGFNCKKHGYTHFSGFIGFDHEKLEEMAQNLSASNAIIRAGNLITATENIDNIYYNTAEKKLQILINDNISEVKIPLDEVKALLKNLSQQKGFFTATEENGVPIDIVNYKKATLLQYSYGKLHFTVNSRSFYVNTTAAQNNALFKSLAPANSQKDTSINASLDKLKNYAGFTVSTRVNLSDNTEEILKIAATEPKTYKSGYDNFTFSAAHSINNPSKKNSPRRNNK